jgi:hypothetical protein
MAVVSIAAQGESGTPSESIQQSLISASDRQCIALMGRIPGPMPAVGPFEIKKVNLAEGFEYLVLGRGACFCSPTGNCAFWVVILSGSSFSVILKTIRVQRYEVLSATAHGRPDLELIAHDSAFQSTHVVYRFDGSRYQRMECAAWDYEDKQNPDRALAKPDVTPCENTQTP